MSAEAVIGRTHACWDAEGGWRCLSRQACWGANKETLADWQWGDRRVLLQQERVTAEYNFFGKSLSYCKLLRYKFSF